MKGREFLDLINDYQLPKKYCFQWFYGMEVYYISHIYSFAVVVI
jgi:hypothetical protein